MDTCLWSLGDFCQNLFGYKKQIHLNVLKERELATRKHHRNLWIRVKQCSLPTPSQFFLHIYSFTPRFFCAFSIFGLPKSLLLHGYNGCLDFQWYCTHYLYWSIAFWSCWFKFCSRKPNWSASFYQAQPYTGWLLAAPKPQVFCLTMCVFNYGNVISLAKSGYGGSLKEVKTGPRNPVFVCLI